MSDVTELNVVTGEEVSRNYNKKERDAISSFKIDGKDEMDLIVAREEQNTILKQEALEVLQNLGLSEDQARAIAGL